MKSSGKRIVRAPALEWLDDLSGREVRITSMGSHALLVENHCGVLCFTAACIRLATHSGCLEICGAHLLLSQVRRDALIIRGRIESIHLPCAKENGHEP